MDQPAPMLDPLAPSLAPPSHSVSLPASERLAQLEAALPTLAQHSPPPTAKFLACLRAFCSYTPTPPLVPYPQNKLAAVLVLLHVNAVGGLSVTLTTRALTLRSHPGETALPGGRSDLGDVGVEATALREANEEILLPLAPNVELLHLATLAAFTSRTLLHVVPVVYLLVSPPAPAILAALVPSPAEVAHIFHLPLKVFLGQEQPTTGATRRSSRRSNSSASVQAKAGTAPVAGSEVLDYAYQDFDWLDGRAYRMHSFSSPDPRVTPSPVEGLTADILIAVALIGYHALNAEQEPLEGRSADKALWKTSYQRWAEGQMSWVELDVAAREARKVWGEKGRGLGDKRTTDK